MAQQQSSLQNIYSRSFPANNLFEVSLVKDTNQDLPFYKPRYFMFVSLTPGGQTEQGGRTFNRDGRITMKTDCEKALALANSIRAYARGQGATLGQFAIFVDSSKAGFGGNGGIKSCFAGEFNQKSQQQGQPEKKMVALSFKSGQNKPIGLFWPPSEAMAIADVIEFIGRKGLELDFDDRQNSVGRTSPQTQNSFQQASPQTQNNFQNTQQSPPSQNTQNVVDNFGDAMNQNVDSAPPIVEDLPF